MRTHRWWTGLSPRRRILLGGLGIVVAVVAVVIGVRVSRGQPEPAAGRPGTVLLVPGYGGSTTSLGELAARIRRTGRTATVVQRTGKSITLGSPLHGARVAAVGTAYDPAQCPVACAQLAPGSALLTRLQQSA